MPKVLFSSLNKEKKKKKDKKERQPMLSSKRNTDIKGRRISLFILPGIYARCVYPCIYVIYNKLFCQKTRIIFYIMLCVGDLACPGVMVGLNYHKDLFQPS